jgi:hypothetical protein
MSLLTALILSNTLCLLLAAALLACTFHAKRQIQKEAIHHTTLLKSVQALRDALHGWLVEGTPSTTHDLQQTITRVTALQTWWVACENAAVTDAQLEHAPFGAEAHLATMALRTRKMVHQHQLAQWGWASSYVPICVLDQPPALLLLAEETPLSIADHALAAAMAEILCNAWTRASQRSNCPAITSA